MSQMLAVGVIAGIALCLLVAGIAISRRRYIKDPDKFDCWLGVPVVASIPHSDNPAALLAFDAPGDLAFEGVRSLATAIDLMTLDTPGCTLAMTGIAARAGTAFVSARLAAVLSTAGQRVLLIDADIEGGNLHEQFNVEAAPGWSDLLAGECPMKQAVQDAVYPNLSFIARGSATGATLAQENVAALLVQCRASFDCVILATPPASVSPAAALIARECKLAFLIARSGRHTQAALDEVIQTMELEQASATGLIFNDQATPVADYHADAQ